MSDPASISPYARTLVDAAHDCGVSYRRADWWVRQGWLNVLVTHVDDSPWAVGYDNAPGSGHTRWLAPYEQQVLRHMAHLTAAGLVAETAHRVARALAMHPSARAVTLAPGITITLGDHAETAHA